MEFQGRKKISTALNIAPLIDVVFQLLLFFMLTANFITQPGIKLILPSAVASKPSSDEEITIFISENSALYLNAAKVSMDGLLEKLKPMVLSVNKKTVMIKADEKISLGLAVKVMDIAKQAGAEGMVVSTKTEKNAR